MEFALNVNKEVNYKQIYVTQKTYFCKKNI